MRHHNSFPLWLISCSLLAGSLAFSNGCRPYRQIPAASNGPATVVEQGDAVQPEPEVSGPPGTRELQNDAQTQYEVQTQYEEEDPDAQQTPEITEQDATTLPEPAKQDTPPQQAAPAPTATEDKKDTEDTDSTPRRTSGAAARQAEASEQMDALSHAFREVAQNVKPSVVQVASQVRPGSRIGQLSSQISPQELEGLVQRYGPLLELDPELMQFFRGRRFEQSTPSYEQYNVPLPVGSASGWIYDDQGHVVTNHHVVAQADRITLTFHDDQQVEATLVGSDPQTDVAVLKVDKSDLVPATISTDSVAPGDIVLAVGSPFRYAFSMSQGIVSATGRQTGILGPGGYEDFIQTDAAINPGNSGGPLVNARGELIGMNTAIASRSGSFAGIGFAIPAPMIQDVVGELLSKGRVERGYLGVMTSDSPQLLASFGVEHGALVEDRVADSPAARVGVQAGDVIVQLDGDPIDSASRLRQKIAETDPGQTVQLTIVRDGDRRMVDVQLEQQPAQNPSQQSASPSTRQQSAPQPGDTPQASPLAKLGFTRLQNFTREIAQQYQLEFVEGVLVLGVRQFSAAAVSGLQRGHIITQVGNQDIADVEQLQNAVGQRDLSDGIRLRIHVPGGPSRFVLLSLDGQTVSN
jgi:serine protease Do